MRQQRKPTSVLSQGCVLVLPRTSSQNTTSLWKVTLLAVGLHMDSELGHQEGKVHSPHAWKSTFSPSYLGVFKATYRVPPCPSLPVGAGRVTHQTHPLLGAPVEGMFSLGQLKNLLVIIMVEHTGPWGSVREFNPSSYS